MLSFFNRVNPVDAIDALTKQLKELDKQYETLALQLSEKRTAIRKAQRTLNKDVDFIKAKEVLKASRKKLKNMTEETEIKQQQEFIAVLEKNLKEKMKDVTALVKEKDALKDKIKKVNDEYAAIHKERSIKIEHVYGKKPKAAAAKPAETAPVKVDVQDSKTAEPKKVVVEVKAQPAAVPASTTSAWYNWLFSKPAPQPVKKAERLDIEWAKAKNASAHPMMNSPKQEVNVEDLQIVATSIRRP